MAPAMKVTIKWEEGADTSSHHVIKITLPRKWKDGPTSKLKSQFIESYNAKFGENKLTENDVHLINTNGHALCDEDIVSQVLQPGDHVRVKSGPAPVKVKASDVKKVPAVSRAVNQPTPSIPSNLDSNVTTAAGVQAAAAKAFDYSKWDRLDLSDDDGADCHPNIDVNSWKRLMAQKRQDRREKEDQKIADFKKKIDKHTQRAKDIQAKIDSGDFDPQLLVDVEDARDKVSDYEKKLADFLAKRKLVADDLCDVAEDATVVSKQASLAPLVPGLPSTDQKKSSYVGPAKPADEALEYDDFIKKYRSVVDKFAALRSDEASEAFLMEHPELLHEHSEGYLLLLTLHTCMTHLEKKEAENFSDKLEKSFQAEELAVARQHLLIQFIMTLAKGKNCDPRDMIRPFFRKTAQNSADRVEGFEDDLVAFVERIRNRAREKMKNGEASPLAPKATEEEEYEPAGLGPGGLDPNEVLPTLPEDMQLAFVNQDTDALRAALEKLSDEEAQYHMQRCVDSGLWAPGPNE